MVTANLLATSGFALPKNITTPAAHQGLPNPVAAYLPAPKIFSYFAASHALATKNKAVSITASTRRAANRIIA